MKNRKFTVVALVALIMAILMCFAGCGKKADAPAPDAAVPAPTAAPTEAPAEVPTEAPTEPAPTEPVWVTGKAKANYVEAVYGSLNKGDKVEVVGKFAHYFVIEAEPYNLLVDEDLVRLESEKEFQSYTVYSRYLSPVYETVYMDTAPIDNLGTNTALTVLEAKNDWLFVQWYEGTGYMRKSDVSNSRISTGGGSSKKSADGTDVNVGDLLSATEQMGSVMLLGTYHGPTMTTLADEGVVIADNIETYIAVFGFGDELKVIASDDTSCTVYLDTDLTVQISRSLVKLEGDAEEPFTGYIKSLAVAYKEYQCRTLVNDLIRNAEIQVLYKLPALENGKDDLYAVIIDGEMLYMEVSDVSMTKTSTSSNSSSSSSKEVWTDPKK